MSKKLLDSPILDNNKNVDTFFSSIFLWKLWAHLKGFLYNMENLNYLILNKITHLWTIIQTMLQWIQIILKHLKADETLLILIWRIQTNTLARSQKQNLDYSDAFLDLQNALLLEHSWGQSILYIILLQL